MCTTRLLGKQKESRLMCGIGGFSLSTNSTINPRSLSNSILSELDARGNQASGYAFRSPNSTGTYKKAVSGASLSMKAMSRKSTDVLLHTRYATHGSISVPANNHPVMSPDNTIALVHNGVIYNHELIRTEIDPENLLPEVDTSVVPAILQSYDRNFDKLNMIDGDASVAWLDQNDTNTMWVARISHSPLFIAQLKDGSFLFASTEDILMRALVKSGLDAELVYCEPVPERTLIGIRNGRMDIVQAIPALDPAYEDSAWYGSYGNFRNMTSGGHNSTNGSINTYPMSISDLDEDYYFSGSRYSDEEWAEYNDTKSSNTTPRYVQFQSAWGTILKPAEADYPNVEGLTVNDYGEYFNSAGHFVGDHHQMEDYGLFEGYTVQG